MKPLFETGLHLVASSIRRVSAALALGWLGYAIAATEPAPVANLQRGQLEAWTAPAGEIGEEAFALGEGEARPGGWGRYSPNERRYFREFLPALFERTLSFQTLPTERTFTWVFTGPRVGLYLAVSERRVEVRTQFHDSPGYATLTKKPERFPRLAVPARQFELGSGESLQAVTVRLDHTLTLTVSLNGREVHRQLWLDEFQRHQVRLEGKGAAVAFKLLQPPLAFARVTVNPAERHQTMLGWGGITTPTAYRELGAEGRRRWWELVAN